VNLEVKSRGHIWGEVHVIILKETELDKFNERKKREWRKLKR
jgi:hypothetical protein